MQWGKLAETGGQGTTPETIQQAWDFDYTNTADNPLVGGGEVTGNANLQFTVNAGSALCKTASGSTRVLWKTTQTALITPPATGTQNWTVYADSDGNIGVSPNPTPPYVTLGVFVVPAGCTSTAGLENLWNVNYALPFGSRLPRLAYWQENAGGGQAAANQFVANVPFYVPTDRTVQVSIRQELYTQPPVSTDLGSGSVLWDLSLDNGAQVGKVELPVDRRRIVQPFDWVITVQKGQHSIAVNRSNIWPGGDFVVYHFGQQDGYVPGSYSVYDLGVAE